MRDSGDRLGQVVIGDHAASSREQRDRLLFGEDRTKGTRDCQRET